VAIAEAFKRPGAGALHTRLDEVKPARLLAGELHDPFELLGRHVLEGGEVIVRVHQPGAREVRLAETDTVMQRVEGCDLFEWAGAGRDAPPPRYRVRWQSANGIWHEHWDPYCFPPLLAEAELARFNAGEHVHAQRLLGAHEASCEGIDGLRFAVWAPEAVRISVVGDFNGWDGRRHPMRVRGGSGVWELFIPGLVTGVLYKFEIRSRHDGVLPLKADPYARAGELRPQSASIAAAASTYEWQDAQWQASRAACDWTRSPMSVYELHAGSWRLDEYGRPLGYRALADQLVPYLQALGFTHVELLPLTEYPLDESWGYQPTGMFAPTCRYGQPDDLKYFIDHCHRHGIGVLLDWVAGHFPRDAHGLARFDGSALYESADPRRATHPDWGTLEFNYGRREVVSFLLSSALYWLEEFHFDGLRVDAVASMLYLDYSRKPGEWTPNAQGGNENLEAVAFLRRLNALTHHEVPGSLTIAEESTSWPGVSRPVWGEGLGFSMKWNMGWMHDTLKYFALDPLYRRHYHGLVTFAALYAFSENFVLPLSHDEVVHGKGSLLHKMPGDDWQRFANLRLLYTLQWCFPGKKLVFMGAELAAPGEWSERSPLPWALLDAPAHAGISRLMGDLNRLYRSLPALHAHDFDAQGFAWLIADDEACSTLAFQRSSGSQRVVVVLNFTPVPRHDYRVGVPLAGRWQECLNSDSRHYGGSDLGNPLPLQTEPGALHGCAQSVRLTLPPLGGVVLQHSSTTTL
jgi:1,4-alpha-glucan branching enzyme